MQVFKCGFWKMLLYFYSKRNWFKTKFSSMCFYAYMKLNSISEKTEDSPYLPIFAWQGKLLHKRLLISCTYCEFPLPLLSLPCHLHIQLILLIIPNTQSIFRLYPNKPSNILNTPTLDPLAHALSVKSGVQHAKAALKWDNARLICGELMTESKCQVKKKIQLTRSFGEKKKEIDFPGFATVPERKPCPFNTQNTVYAEYPRIQCSMICSSHWERKYDISKWKKIRIFEEWLLSK